MSDNVYEVVKQKDKGYYTIFKGVDQYCDDDGTPIVFDDIEDAQAVCDNLNEVFEWKYNEIMEQMED